MVASLPARVIVGRGGRLLHQTSYSIPVPRSRTMSTTTYKYVIVGAGNSAGYAARAFTENNVGPGELCLIGEEPVHPYERPALSKAFLTNPVVRLPKFHTCVGGGGPAQPPAWYDDNGIVTRLGERATAVDASRKSVTLESGDSIAASTALIIATGADPIRLTRTSGHDLSGIHYLRNNADALQLADALAANKGEHVIIVGGGYIGMEVTAAAVTVGCKVSMVFPEEHVMPRLFTPEIAAPYEQLYEDLGVTLLQNGRVCKQFLGDDDGSVRGIVMCKDGETDVELSGKLVVVGVGARPATDLLKGQVVMDARGGVEVSPTFETSAPGVYAIGDIATFPLLMYGNRPARMEHVQNARDSAAHVVTSITTASPTPYDYLPYFYSRVFHMSWKFFGDNVGTCYIVSELVREELKDWTVDKGMHPQMLAIWVGDGGKLAGTFMESPSDEDTANMEKVAREQPKVDVEAFSKCETVADAWEVVL